MGSNHKAHPADAVLPTDAIVVVVFDDAQLPLQQPLDAAAHLVHVRKLLEREHRPLALRIVLLARNVRRPRGALGHAVVVASILVEYLPPLAATHQRHRVNRHRLVPQRLLRCVHELRLEETPHDQHPRCRQRIGLRQRLGNGTEGTMVYGPMKLVQVALVSRLCQHGVHLLQLLHRDRNLGRPHLAEHLHARLVLAALGKRGGQHPPSRLPVRLSLADAVLPLRSEFRHVLEKREERSYSFREHRSQDTTVPGLATANAGCSTDPVCPDRCGTPRVAAGARFFRSENCRFAAFTPTVFGLVLPVLPFRIRSPDAAAIDAVVRARARQAPRGAAQGAAEAGRAKGGAQAQARGRCQGQ